MFHSPTTTHKTATPRHATPGSGTTNTIWSPNSQPTPDVDATNLTWERSPSKRLSPELQIRAIPLGILQVPTANPSLDALRSVLTNCSASFRQSAEGLGGGTSLNSGRLSAVVTEHQETVDELLGVSERLCQLEQLAELVAQLGLWCAATQQIHACQREAHVISRHGDDARERHAEAQRASDGLRQVLGSCVSEGLDCRAENLRLEQAERVVSQAPKRLADLGDYVARLEGPGRDTLITLRQTHAAAIEAKRRHALAQRVWFRDRVPPPNLSPCVSPPARCNTKTASVLRVRDAVAFLRQPALSKFAIPTCPRWRHSQQIYARALAAGQVRRVTEALYNGSERQREARSIFGRAVERFSQHLLRQELRQAVYTFSPFFLDDHQHAEVIDASESVADELSLGNHLSSALATDLPPQYSGRNRGPFVHAILSFKPGYDPTNAQIAVYARRVLVALGLDLHRYKFAIIRHHDAPNAHVHLVWCRIRDDGALISHPALTRDRICHLLGAVQDQLVIGRTFRDALGGSSPACRHADHVLEMGGASARLTDWDGRVELRHLQGERAARRVAAIGFLQSECIGGIAKVLGYWSPIDRATDGRTLDNYLAKTVTI